LAFLPPVKKQKVEVNQELRASAGLQADVSADGLQEKENQTKSTP